MLSVWLYHHLHSYIYLHCLYELCHLFTFLSKSILLLESCQLHVTSVNNLHTVRLQWFNNLCHKYNSNGLKQLRNMTHSQCMCEWANPACSEQEHETSNVMSFDKNHSSRYCWSDFTTKSIRPWVKQISDQLSAALTHDLSPVWLCNAAFFSM